MVQFDERDASHLITRLGTLNPAMTPDLVAHIMNDLAKKKRDFNVPKELSAAASTTSWPVVSLDIRIQEFVKGMVGGLLLDESEVQELVMKAYTEAIAALDWKRMMKEAIEGSIRMYADKACQEAIRYAFSSNAVNDALRIRMIELLKKGGNPWED